MKVEVRLELEEVYGGDSITRPIKTQSTKFNKVTKDTRVKESVGVKVDDSLSKQRTEEKDDIVHTFKGLENGVNGTRPSLRLGGPYGKFWGALRSAGQRLASIGDPDFKSIAAADRLIFNVGVSPVWVELDGQIVSRRLPQKLRGFGGMIFQNYDVVEKCEVVVFLEYPDAVDKYVKRLLDAIQYGGHFNKRRTMVKVASVKELKAMEATKS